MLCDIAGRAHAQNLVQMLGRKTETRAHAAHVIFGDERASLQVIDEIQRAAELSIALLACLAAIIDFAKRFPSGARTGAKLLQISRFKRETVIWPAAFAVEREMLFNDRGAKDNAGDGGGVIQRVIGEARDETKPLDHIGDGRQIVIMGRGGIAADTMQDRQLLRPAIARGCNCFGNLLVIGHAGGDNHRLAGSRDIADQRQVNRLKRGNFIGWRAQIFEQINRRFIKGRGEHGDVMRPCMSEQRRVPFPRRMGLLV